MIPTKLHGYIDYLMGLFLIIVAYLLPMSNPFATWILLAMGICTIFYSALTEYEYGVVGLINIKVHLFIDILVGLFVALSPWLFDFADEIYLPFLIIGAWEILVSFMTAKKSNYPETV